MENKYGQLCTAKDAKQGRSGLIFGQGQQRPGKEPRKSPMAAAKLTVCEQASKCSSGLSVDMARSLSWLVRAPSREEQDVCTDVTEYSVRAPFSVLSAVICTRNKVRHGYNFVLCNMSCI